MASDDEHPERLPSDAELEILNDLWSSGPSTVREVHDHLSPHHPIGYTTILKQMQVMTEKGLLRRNERFRSHLYEPTIPRGEMQARLAGDLMRRAFQGSAKNLLLGALSAQVASKQELNEIRQLLEQFEKGKKNK
jgi:BlaI family penicillinase repressor